MVRLRASLLSILRCSSSASDICRLMVSTGLRLVIGSWKIIAMLFPRIPRTSSSSIFRTSAPSNMMEPLTILPGRKREKTQEQERGHGLPAAGLPDDAELPARRNLERNTVDRPDDAV